MKILIVVTMIVVFISAFFIFFTTEGILIKGGETCTTESCDVGFYSTLFGASVIASFLLISILAIYVVTKTLSSADIGQSKTL